MNAPGKGMLKVSSILLIIFGAIDIFVSGLGLACASWVTNAAAQVDSVLGTAVAAALTVTVIIGLVLAVLGGALDLVFGIMGIKKSEDPAQGNFFIVAGIILCALQLIAMILNFSVMGVIGFVLPILFIIGGFQNKNASSAPAAQ